eukprot:m51a1_g10188 hypothetical protein (190) ;mRNA; r:1364-2310
MRAATVVALAAAALLCHAGVAAAIDITDLVNIGKIFWSVVEKGQQVVNYKEDFATALPRDVAPYDVEQLADWSAGPYGWVFRDSLGVAVAEFSWLFTAQCNGSYAGHGRFLTNAGAFVKHVYAAWGFGLDVNASVPMAPVNYGTKEEPVAGLQVSVAMTVTTAVQTYVYKCLATVRGDCKLNLIACDGY